MTIEEDLCVEYYMHYVIEYIYVYHLTHIKPHTYINPVELYYYDQNTKCPRICTSADIS